LANLLFFGAVASFVGKGEGATRINTGFPVGAHVEQYVDAEFEKGHSAIFEVVKYAVPNWREDGILTAYETMDMDLQGPELVVMSACKTGLGEVMRGEGVFGLRRALEEAGAQSVLMSLWSVPDRETQELMVRFYRKWLGGKQKQEALQEAQMEMRELVKTRYGKDMPLFWGAFVLLGR